MDQFFTFPTMALCAVFIIIFIILGILFVLRKNGGEVKGNFLKWAFHLKISPPNSA